MTYAETTPTGKHIENIENIQRRGASEPISSIFSIVEGGEAPQPGGQALARIGGDLVAAINRMVATMEAHDRTLSVLVPELQRQRQAQGGLTPAALAELVALLDPIYALQSTSKWTVRQLLDMPGDSLPLQRMRVQLARVGDNDPSTIGLYLRRCMDTPAGGFVLRAEGFAAAKVRQWSVRRVG